MTYQCGVGPFLRLSLRLYPSGKSGRSQVTRMAARVRLDSVLIAPVGAVGILLRHDSS